jgi:8-oxo-dGTP pyrophosphatase MutT (NUDIX family)
MTNTTNNGIRLFQIKDKTTSSIFQGKNTVCSYGIIAYTYINGVRKYLMIRRKHTIGYGVVLRGKYEDVASSNQLNDAIDRMTVIEKERILNEPFDVNWNFLWNLTSEHTTPYPIEKQLAYDKYTTNFEYIARKIQQSITTWNEPEWEFPKGRINSGEQLVDCALREFTEETRINIDDIHLIKNVSPFEEYYISFDNKKYKNIYFLAFLDVKVYDLGVFQEDEVSKMNWFTELECIKHIRPYYCEKKRVIRNVETLLNEFLVI